MEDAFLLKTIISFVVAGIWIGGATLLAERLGSKKGGLITNLPSTVLIALVFVALVQDARFAANATDAVPIGMLITTLFLLVFILLLKYGLIKTILLSLSAWLVLAFLAQKIHLSNIIFNIIVIKLGYGVVGVAWVTVCTQGLVTFMLYRFIKGYIFEDMKEFLRFQVRILIPFLIVIPFYFFHNYLGLATSSLWAFTGISLAVQVIIWGLVIGIFYRDYLSINKIKAVMKEINITK